MMSTPLTPRSLWASLLCVLALEPYMVAGQTAKAIPPKPAVAVRNWRTPRTAWGDPDLQGIWDNSTTTPLERPRDLAGKETLSDEEIADKNAAALSALDAPPQVGDPGTYNGFWYDKGKPLKRTSLIIDPPDGRVPPLTPEAQRREAARGIDRNNSSMGPAASWKDVNLAVRCITRGAPKLPGGYNNNYHILQSPGYVTILQEMIHEVRVIPLDNRPHLSSAVRQWLGDSRGHWDGDTLVVDTTNFNDDIRFNSIYCCRGAGANLHVTERFTRIGPGEIDYQFTFEDPTTWTRPWTAGTPLRATQGPIYEYACHEGNMSMTGILSAARAEERSKAAAKSSK